MGDGRMGRVGARIGGKRSGKCIIIVFSTSS